MAEDDKGYTTSSSLTPEDAAGTPQIEVRPKQPEAYTEPDEARLLHQILSELRSQGKWRIIGIIVPSVMLLLATVSIIVSYRSYLAQQQSLAVQQGFAGPLSDKSIAGVRIAGDSRSIEALNKESLIVWRRSLAGVAKKALVANLFGNEESEVIVGMGAEGPRAGQLLIYGSRGTLASSIQTGVSIPLDWVRSGNFTIQDLAILPPEGDAPAKIIALTYDSGWFASGVEIFTVKGALEGSYWNPGGAGELRVMKIGRVGTEVIVVHASNNDLTSIGSQILGIPFASAGKYVDALFGLPVLGVKGLAPPHSGGNHLWYYVLWPIGTNIAGFKEDKLRGQAIIKIDTNVGCLFYIGEKGRLRQEGVGDACVEGTRLLTVDEFIKAARNLSPERLKER